MIQAVLKLVPQALDTTYGCGNESATHGWATNTTAAADLQSRVCWSLLSRVCWRNFNYLQSLLMAAVNTLQLCSKPKILHLQLSSLLYNVRGRF